MDLSYIDLKELTDGFCNLISVRKLCLGNCNSLKKLPKSFIQLKYLERLDLSICRTLEELCIGFKGLSSLRVLSLKDCPMLKKLPEDFHCLASLELLDLSNCNMLEGEWMESMVKMKTLQMLNISRSTLLEERWAELQGQWDQPWSLAVYTRQGFSNKENIEKQLLSEFDCILTNGQGGPVKISNLPPNTLLLVMYDGIYNVALSLIERNLEDIQTKFEMIYFGNNFVKLPKKVADKILGHAPANTNADTLFQKVFAIASDSRVNDNFELRLLEGLEISAKIGSDEKGNKYLSHLEILSKESAEEFVVKKCGRYPKLKQPVERPEESNTMLLRGLFASGEEEISLGFLKKGAPTKVAVDELKGKRILLDIRPANICDDIRLQSLVDMYVAEKEGFDFEIITIIIMQPNPRWDVSEKFSREVPWLVLQNQWQRTNVTTYFLVKECQEGDPNKMIIIESNGAITKPIGTQLLRMVDTWGREAYPFTEDKRRELIETEVNQMKAMSNLLFLFNHLESKSEQVEKAMRQQKLIWLCTSNQREFTNSIKNVLKNWNDIIYLIYIPQLDERSKFAYLTEAIYEWYSVLEPPKMPEEMQGISLLNLSEHELMRFWSRIYCLRQRGIWLGQGIEELDDENDKMEMLLNAMDEDIAVMDEDGNLVTTEGLNIVKLLCKEHLHDKVKELMQRLIKGAQENCKETLVELKKLLDIDDSLPKEDATSRSVNDDSITTNP